MLALAVLFAPFGSVSFSAVFVAVFVSDPMVVTVAVMVSVSDPPPARPPIFQTPVTLL